MDLNKKRYSDRGVVHCRPYNVDPTMEVFNNIISPKNELHSILLISL